MKSLIGPPLGNPQRVPGWWQHLTLNQTLDPYLVAKSVQNTLWSDTPIVTASHLTRLWTHLDAITSNLYSDQSAMQMEDLINTRSAIEWAERDSNPGTCDASTFNSAYNYTGKDGNVLVADFERSDIEHRGTSHEGKVALLECFNASTKDQFLENIRNVAPRLYMRSYNKLQLVAEHHYPSKPVIYRSPDPADSWRLIEKISNWCNTCHSLYSDDSCKGIEGLRPLSLILYGGTRTGKREWRYKYLVLGDVELSRMDILKCWFGSQREFTSTDKYCRKKHIIHSRPVIGCFNEDTRFGIWADSEWIESHASLKMNGGPNGPQPNLTVTGY
ncbi:hypothetical protein B9Z19DRAFT_1069720 [Tuber borchii]|uniref:Geminivirus AL1 replication-associated protein central domain-containing protein n=1 Tax=Tuber borchii TaxID=42251 RepID=A0A2T6ZAJ8_TUBBO|nr:hypothetical protein B9Z19DRAFT_1069720 [Tuber borchii]